MIANRKIKFHTNISDYCIAPNSRQLKLLSFSSVSGECRKFVYCNFYVDELLQQGSMCIHVHSVDQVKI